MGRRASTSRRLRKRSGMAVSGIVNGFKGLKVGGSI
jgi:hypothetical protein